MFNEEERGLLNILKNIVRVGRISSINDSKGTVRVKFDDKDDMVSGELPMFDFEYRLPQIEQPVLCIFLPNGISQGFCFGGFYSENNLPPVSDRNIYFKDFGDGTSIQYNKTSKELVINVMGDLKVKVKGNILIEADGSITTKAGEANTSISNTKTNPIVHHP